MGFIKNLANRMGGAAEDYDDYDDYEEYDDYDDDNYTYYQEESAPKRTVRATRMESNNKVVNIQATAKFGVVVFHPESTSDALAVAACLVDEKNTVVVNLENADKEVYRRVVDFLSGVAYASRGKIKNVAKRTYIITPYNVGITGAEVIDELENNGVFF